MKRTLRMGLYLYLNGGRRGPVSAERVDALLAEGILHPSDLASATADSELKALSVLRALPIRSSEAPPPSPPPPIPLPPLPPATLSPNETPVFKTALHWIIFVRFAVLGLLVFLFIAMPFAIGVQALTGSEVGWFALPLPVFMMLPPTLAFVSSELVITDRRVLIKTGIVRRQTLEMFVSKVESIAIEQGLLGRLLDYGTIVIRGTGGNEEPFETIARPGEFRDWVQRLQKRDERPRSDSAAS